MKIAATAVFISGLVVSQLTSSSTRLVIFTALLLAGGLWILLAQLGRTFAEATPWLCLGGAVLTISSASTYSAVTYLLGKPGSPNTIPSLPADLALLLGCGLLGVGCLRILGYSGALRGDGLLDVTTVGGVVAILSWALMVQPAISSGTLNTSEAISAMTVVVLLGFAVGFVTRLLTAGAAPPGRTGLVLSAVTCSVVGIIASLDGLVGAVPPEGRGSAFAVFGVLLSALAASSPIPARSDIETVATRITPLVRVATQAAIVSALPVVALVQFWRGSNETLSGILGGLVVLGPTVLWRSLQVIHQRDEAVAETNQREAWYRSVVDHALEGIVLVDTRLQVMWVGGGEVEVLGQSCDGKVGLPLAHLLGPACSAYLRAHLSEGLSVPGQIVEFESHAEHADGRRRWLELRCVNRVNDPSVGGILVNFRDVTRRKEAEQRLAFDARHDPLTRLANRVELMDRLVDAERRSEKRKGGGAALYFLDLDRFKLVNDSLGHQAGDRLLSVVAERLRRSVRSTDVVARFGGDEFAVLCEGLEGDEGIEAMAERIRKALADPVHLGGQAVTVTASIGVRKLEGRGEAADELVREADIAMYAAKESGRDRSTTFDERLQEQTRRRLHIDRGLRSAVDNGEMHIFYQPIVSLQSGRIIEVEALLRWQHPDLGFLVPDQFIAAAEETGLIVPIGDWVIRSSLRQVAKWTAAGLQAPAVAVNLSPRQLVGGGDPVRSVVDALEESRAGTGSLVLEITESSLIDQTERAVQTVWELRRLGVRIALDDFGTGYSSLAYLLRLPVGGLKIDRMFVSRLGEDEHADALVAAVVGLGKSLGHRVVAEGVETPAQIEVLRRLGVDFGQGYLFGKPQPADEMTALIAAGPIAIAVNAATAA